MNVIVEPWRKAIGGIIAVVTICCCCTSDTSRSRRRAFREKYLVLNFSLHKFSRRPCLVQFHLLSASFLAKWRYLLPRATQGPCLII
jgi:hypothetical protein